MFQVHRCSVAELAGHGDAISELLGDGMDALVVERALPVESTRRAVERLEQPDEDCVRTEPPARTLYTPGQKGYCDYPAALP